jgi:hypothetical protein
MVAAIETWDSLPRDRNMFCWRRIRLSRLLLQKVVSMVWCACRVRVEKRNGRPFGSDAHRTARSMLRTVLTFSQARCCRLRAVAVLKGSVDSAVMVVRRVAAKVAARVVL